MDVTGDGMFDWSGAEPAGGKKAGIVDNDGAVAAVFDAWVVEGILIGVPDGAVECVGAVGPGVDVLTDGKGAAKVTVGRGTDAGGTTGGAAGGTDGVAGDPFEVVAEGAFNAIVSLTTL